MRPRKRDRLAPMPWHADYVQLRALRAQIAGTAERRWRPGAGISVLDVGCSEKPYAPLLAPYAERHVGTDHRPGEHVDVMASADQLPFDEGSFDCVLCTQVLQYVPNPQAAVAEMARMLRAGGVLLASTHGVGFIDRSADDRWRWTPAGLQDLLAAAVGWDSIEIFPAGGVLCAGAYLVGGQAEFAAHKAGLAGLAAALCAVLNAAAWNGDRLVRRMYPGMPPDASVNYLAVARKA